MDDTQTSNDKKIITDHATNLLSRRPQSIFEMRVKLERFAKRRQIPAYAATIQDVIDEMQDKDILNDDTFASWYARERLDFKQISKVRLRKELAQKGIASAIISRTVDSYDEELACRTLAQRKKHMDENQLKQYLQRQGFGYSLIEDILGK